MEKLILIDMLVEQIIKISQRIQAVKDMSGEEVDGALAQEDERTKLLIELLKK